MGRISLFLIFLPLLSAFFFRAEASTRVQNTPVGHFMMVGFSEKTLTPSLTLHLKKIKPGAIILFKRNIESPEQLQTLVSDLRRTLEPDLGFPLLVAIDQEGGSVFRVPVEPLIPSAAAIGKVNKYDLVENYGAAVGKVLRQMGINMNLAPVLDIDLQNRSGFIGSRSFSKTPEAVARMGFSFAKGLAAVGVIPTGKHFPGLGSLRSDPHLTSPTSDLEWRKDWNRELLPFREMVPLMPSALMLSHVIYPKMDPQKRPATLSPYIIDRVLRKTLKYEGLVITDDLLMKGITNITTPETAAIQSLQYGADFIMLSWSRIDQWRVFKALQKASQNGDLKKSLLREKLRRIQSVTEQAKSVEGPNEPGPLSWRRPDIKALNEKLLSFTLEQDFKTIEKLKNIKKIFLVNLSPSWTEAAKLKKPLLEINPVTDLQSLLKDRPPLAEDTLVLVGLSNRSHLFALENIPPSLRGRLHLVITASLEIRQPEHYRGVIAPLWPLEGLENGVLNRLFESTP